MTSSNKQTQGPSPTGAAGRKAGLRIGGRIVLLAGLAVVGLVGLCGAYLISDARIGSATRLADRYNELARLAALVDSGALQMRRREKDFILRRDEELAGQYRDSARSLIGWLDAIEKMAVGAGVKDAVGGIRSKMTAHIDQFERLVALDRRLGLDENAGLQGSLRKAVHEVESRLREEAKHEGAVIDRLIVKMLMMRRHEKDFILRGDDKYIQQLDARRTEFIEALTALSIPDFEREQITRLLNQYVYEFLAYAEVYKAERETRIQLGATYDA
ncbi:MAG: hypothetical protein OEQ29_21305, partial [Alphaproteobacteria bacterium]|nr:hypothetical protein [Alphaproteobacteria bacterium]